jgi:exodeoxyribonuclease-5
MSHPDRPTDEQQKAIDAFDRFLDTPGETLFALLGWAGCGKSFTSSHMYRSMEFERSSYEEMLWLAPTWKAVHVSGRFLKNQKANFETRFDSFRHELGTMVLTTTQQGLGIAPVIDDEQTSDSMKFASINKGAIRELKPRFIVIDEVSMLSRKSLMKIYGMAKDVGAKILIVGDPGQLPPVGEKEIKWSGIKNRHELRTIMRQASGSAIPVIGEAIRTGRDWSKIRGNGVERAKNVYAAFLDTVGVPSDQETERDVFIGYRNQVVNKIQEAACKKVYGHGRNHVEVGQLVLAQSSISQLSRDIDTAQYVEERICNQDELVVIGKFGEGEWGEQVRVETWDGKVFDVEYLTQSAISNPNHPYNVELRARADRARTLQAQYKKGLPVNTERTEAWKAFFHLKDNAVLSFAHPFAVTSHKSQGSSYRRAFVDARDIENYSSRGLYVAATRPKETLVI